MRTRENHLIIKIMKKLLKKILTQLLLGGKINEHAERETSRVITLRVIKACTDL